jgi:uncharacterized membrane protein YhaH (DUF805 family)
MVACLFSFNGRIGRLAYAFSFGVYVLLIFLALLMAAVGSDDPGSLFSLLPLLMLWIVLAGVTKRFRDAGFSAWFALLCFVPIIGLFVPLIVLFIRKTAFDLTPWV